MLQKGQRKCFERSSRPPNPALDPGGLRPAGWCPPVLFRAAAHWGFIPSKSIGDSGVFPNRSSQRRGGAEDLLPGLDFSSVAARWGTDSANNSSPARSFSLKFLLLL